MDTQSRIRSIAETQRWLVTSAQLFGADLSVAAVRNGIRTKRLWTVYPGVYAVGNPEMDPARERLAAVLACGEGAGLSLASAAFHWGCWEWPAPLRQHVSVANRSGRAGALPNEAILAARIQIHRPRLLIPGVDTTVWEGIPVTTLGRTAHDLAGELQPWELRKFLRQIERVHRFDLRLLSEFVAEAPRNAWRAARLRKALRYVLDDSGTTQTEREALFLDICRRFGMPQPRPQRVFGRGRVDFIYDDLWLIIEIDDRSSHDGYVAFLEDRRRDRQNANRGFETIRFTVSECRHEPALVAADTLKALERRRHFLRLSA